MILHPFLYLPFQNYLLLSDKRFAIFRYRNQIDIFAPLPKLHLIKEALSNCPVIHSSWVRVPPTEDGQPSLALLLKTKYNCADYEAYLSNWLKDNYDLLVPTPL